MSDSINEKVYEETYIDNKENICPVCKKPVKRNEPPYVVEMLQFIEKDSGSTTTNLYHKKCWSGKNV